MTNPIIHYFFVQSPWSYFGFRRAVDIAARHGVKILHKPVRAAEIWKHGGGVPLAQRPKPRQEYRLLELARWRDLLGLPLNLQPASFPVDETLAAKTIIAVLQDGGNADLLIETLMGDIWARERNIADPAIIREALSASHLDTGYLDQASNDDIDAVYTANTEAAKADNIFGVPTYFANGEMFWGQDRLDFVDRALMQK
ncbi:2-hydroxychromene-2-carboxylate isomerase [Thalassospira sp.]|uniref:2-hydroxychromene-2-carboxylate isomerase n=1 Tax=Thalassospira sp. TaxID=1912094 RepID=UPI00273328C9|nr:2-hydroxychromene-2-carboxylate isomerase [Thalassospira sp.]MDP2700087.1 2-hydroxychromene-2-carboxylate isomerase [Thalassospira sp.]